MELLVLESIFLVFIGSKLFIFCSMSRSI